MLHGTLDATVLLSIVEWLVIPFMLLSLHLALATALRILIGAFGKQIQATGTLPAVHCHHHSQS